MSAVVSGCGSIVFPFNTQNVPKDSLDLDYLEQKEICSSLCQMISAESSVLDNTLKNIKNYFPEKSTTLQISHLRNTLIELQNQLCVLQELINEIKSKRTNSIK